MVARISVLQYCQLVTFGTTQAHTNYFLKLPIRWRMKIIIDVSNRISMTL